MPSAWLLALALGAPHHTPDTTEPRLILELRLFNGAEEVTSQTRVTVHRAGTRDEPVAQLPSGSPQLEVNVPPGLYDVQAIREREGRVLNIRWAQRLVVMPYPDERGRHLEVVNFQNGYGALQVRVADAAQARVSVYKPGDRQKEAGAPFSGRDYVLFILPAGPYDLQVISRNTVWQNGVEVPLDRTRLWVIP